MKLVKLYLKDFRGYDEIEIEFHPDMNVIIGRNDVGKSTILDALNIFFNDEVKPEITDCNIRSQDKKIIISAFFKLDENEQIIIDATHPTSLAEEYLLNKDQLLEIRKVISADGKTISKSNISVFLNTYHPKIFEEPLITKTLSQLKEILSEYEDQIPYPVNKTKKAEIRKALFSHVLSDDTEFEEKLINIKDIQEDRLKTWDKLKESLPLFTLFQADRTNNDGDKEVQDPMKAITKEVLAELESKLNEIRDEVVKRVEEIGKETIEKLKEFNPEISSQLKTVPDLKNWDSVFKFSLDTDDGIPLNKRGSGVRRLILLSYFRAQAEKSAKETGKKTIIYAIEEPETSQHPDFQKMLIESLINISQRKNHQVFITTHTPEIAQMVDKSSLILIKKDHEGRPCVVDDEDVKIREIVKTLGILPTIHSRLVICVEGPNDVKFLKNINQAIPEYKQIIDLEKSDISIYDVGGGKLINWINENHFRKSNIKEFHLYDNDVEKYRELVNKMKEENDGRRTGIITELREMENYIPISLLEEEFKCNLQKFRDKWKEFDVAKHLSQVCPSLGEKEIKSIINGKLTKKVTTESLREHGVFDEIKQWFEEIKKMYDSTFS